MVEHQKQELKKKLQHLPNPLLSEDEEALVTRIVEEFVLDVPTLVEADLYATEKQVQIDARTLRNRVVFDHSRPVYVAATQITVHIPFRGDAGMFEVQPSTYTMNPPIGEIHDGEIHLIYEIADASISITDQYKRTLGEIRQHLEALRPTAEQLNTDLKHLVRSLLAKRKHEATAHSQLVGSLGIPVRKAAPIAATPATPASSGARLKQTAPKKSPPARKCGTRSALKM